VKALKLVNFKSIEEALDIIEDIKQNFQNSPVKTAPKEEMEIDNS